MGFPLRIPLVGASFFFRGISFLAMGRVFFWIFQKEKILSQRGVQYLQGMERLSLNERRFYEFPTSHASIGKGPRIRSYLYSKAIEGV